MARIHKERIKNVDDDESAWEATGQTFSGKGPSGEEMLFMLQKRGTQFRVKPKGGGKEERPEEERPEHFRGKIP